MVVCCERSWRSNNPLRSQLGNIEGIATAGQLFLENRGPLQVGDVATLVNGISAQGVFAKLGVFVGASSPITVFENITASGQIVLIARDESFDPLGNEDNITVLPGRIVETIDSPGVQLPGLIEGTIYSVEIIGNAVVLHDLQSGLPITLGYPLPDDHTLLDTDHADCTGHQQSAAAKFRRLCVPR